MVDIIEQGTYDTEKNKVFKLNNLPTMKLPDNPPSVKIPSMARASGEGREEAQEKKK